MTKSRRFYGRKRGFGRGLLKGAVALLVSILFLAAPVYAGVYDAYEEMINANTINLQDLLDRLKLRDDDEEDMVSETFADPDYNEIKEFLLGSAKGGKNGVDGDDVDGAGANTTGANGEDGANASGVNAMGAIDADADGTDVTGANGTNVADDTNVSGADATGTNGEDGTNANGVNITDTNDEDGANANGANATSTNGENGANANGAEGDGSASYRQVFTNEDTGYYAVLLDEAGLLETDAAERVMDQMQPVSDYCNVVFLSNTEEYTGSEVGFGKTRLTDLSEADHFDGRKSVLLMIDMYKRKLVVYGGQDVYSVISSDISNSITDNIYTYATKGDYEGAARQAFTQIYRVFDGQKIAQPMRYITAALLAVFVGLAVGFILVRVKTKRKEVSYREITNTLTLQECEPIVSAQLVSTKRVRHVESSGGGGGGFSGGGGGGFSGGGGGIGGGGGSHGF